MEEPLTAVEQRAPGRWQIGTVTSIKPETPRVKSFRIEVPMWMPHLPGQHYDVRLTAPDGYRAQRSYSIASSPLDEGEIELTIDRLEDGEVSPYFHDVVVEGDQVEVRGPFASYFVWRGEKPVLLVGGGSGVVPLMAILRHRRRTMPELPMRLVYSVRNADDVIYADELDEDAVLTFTRESPDGWRGHTGRIDRELIADVRDRLGHRVRLRLERVRRDRLRAPPPGGLRATSGPHRALRANRLIQLARVHSLLDAQSETPRPKRAVGLIGETRLNLRPLSPQPADMSVLCVLRVRVPPVPALGLAGQTPHQASGTTVRFAACDGYRFVLTPRRIASLTASFKAWRKRGRFGGCFPGSTSVTFSKRSRSR